MKEIKNIYIKYAMQVIVVYIIFLCFGYIFHAIEHKQIAFEMPFGYIEWIFLLNILMIGACIGILLEVTIDYFEENPKKHIILEKLFYIFCIALLGFVVIRYIYKFFLLGIFIKHGLQSGNSGIIFTLSFIAFFLIIGVYWSKVLDKYFTKEWETDSVIGKIKVRNSWNLKMNSKEELYLDEELLSVNELNWKDSLMSYARESGESRILGMVEGKFGRELESIEGRITPRKGGLTMGCDIYLNGEKIFSS